MHHAVMTGTHLTLDTASTLLSLQMEQLCYMKKYIVGYDWNYIAKYIRVP